MIQSTEVLEFSGVRAILRSYLRGPLALEQLQELQSKTDLEEIREELASVGEAMAFLRENTPPALGHLEDPKPLLERLRIAGTCLEPLELRHLAALARASHEVRSFFDPTEFPRLRGRGAAAPNLLPLANRVEGKILPDGFVDSSASPLLKEIRRQSERTRKKIEKALGNFLQAHRKDATLQDAVVSIHNDRYVVPVKAGEKRRIGGIVHGTSSSGASLFIEPLETVPLNNERVELQENEAAEIRRFLVDLTETFRGHQEELWQVRGILAELDLLFARARFGREYDCCLPKLDLERRISLKKARHPLLEKTARAQGQRVVPITLTLQAPKTIMVISGPNSGGKTVVLKTVGLLALMAQAGIPVPAEEAYLPVFDNVGADIGDLQSIEQSLSTFSAHVANIQSMVESAGGRDLILLDEIGASTDPSEGAALAMAILDHFRKCGALTLASTHHTRLKAYGAETPEAVNAGMEFDEVTLRPTYRLLIGLPGKSSGIDIAARLGLEPSIIEQARRLVSSTQSGVSRLLESLHATRQRTESIQKELESRLRAFEEREKSLEQEYLRDRRKQLAALEERLEETLSEYEKRFRVEVDALKRLALPKIDPAARRRASTLERDARRGWEEQVRKELGDAAPSTHIQACPKVGDRVRIRGISTPGEVTTVVEEDKIEVEVGRLRMRVGKGDITEILSGKVAGARARVLSAVSAIHQKPSDSAGVAGPELHVRGLRADEARDVVDKFLDQSVVQGYSEVRVVHGKGTGTLRSVLREMLTGHPHVAEFRTAEPERGGDGVTVVTLRTGG